MVIGFGYWVINVATEESWSSEGMKVALAAGAVLAFLHKHSLECDRECLRLFEQYNEKFAKLKITKSKLQEVDAGYPLLEEYLDLCSEEYLLFLQGRIHPTIWRSWATGMREYLQLKEAKALLGDGSRYYGLTLNRIS